MKALNHPQTLHSPMEFPKIKISDKLSRSVDDLKSKLHEFNDSGMSVESTQKLSDAIKSVAVVMSSDSAAYYAAVALALNNNRAHISGVIVVGDPGLRPGAKLPSTSLMSDLRKSLNPKPSQRKNPFVYHNSEPWRKRR